MKKNWSEVRREDVIRRLCELAFAPANDAIRLAYLDEPSEKAVKKLDLSSVAEFKRNSAGSVEIKFIDRVKALGELERLLGGGDADASEAFFRALEEAGEESGPWR